MSHAFEGIAMAHAADAAMLSEIQSLDSTNAFCFDCNTPSPEWASISHGIYVSIGASSVHRSLGVGTSRVQSLKLDAWKPVHCKMMRLGGNRRFREFLLEHGVSEDIPIRELYGTRAAEWYRKDLWARASDLEALSPLAPGTGHLPAESIGGMSAGSKLVLDQVYAEAACEVPSPCRLPPGVLGSAPAFRRGPASGSPSPGASLCRVLCHSLLDAIGSPRKVGSAAKGAAALGWQDASDESDVSDHSDDAADRRPCCPAGGT